MSPQPYYSDDFVTIYHGDAPTVLAELENSVDAVLTDPPYASGSRTEASKVASGAMLRSNTERSRSTRFGDRPIDLDQMTTAGFMWLLRTVALDCYDRLPDGGSFVSFIDWRQWPNLVGAIETCNYRVQGMVVWDKGAIGMGNGFRAQHELACHASKGVPVAHDRGTPNVLTVPGDDVLERLVLDRVFHHKRVPPINHPSPKPEPLMVDLLRVVCPQGGTVLDPFMGAGTTLVAAKQLGMRAIGIEKNADYCALAVERCGGPLRHVDGALDFGAAP